MRLCFLTIIFVAYIYVAEAEEKPNLVIFLADEFKYFLGILSFKLTFIKHG